MGFKEGKENEILEHEFFRSSQWDALTQRQLPPPFIPSPGLNVDLEFIQARPELSETSGMYTTANPEDFKNMFDGFDFYNAKFYNT